MIITNNDYFVSFALSCELFSLIFVIDIKIFFKNLTYIKYRVDIKLKHLDRYRKVVTLGEDAAGQLALTRLEPGDYYLALEKREYKFEPNQIEMHFAGRKRVEIKALRYQYSAIGQLSSLSQAGLGNAAVQGKESVQRKKK